MVNADSTIAATPPRHAARGWRPNSLLLGPGTKRPGEGNRPSVSLVSEVSGFLSSEWNPIFIIFFHSKLMSFSQKLD
jgi:hypothetical protein